MNGFNAAGLGFELLGVIFIWIYARQTRGMPTQAIIARYRLTRWLNIGIRLVVFGVLIQLTGFFFGWKSPERIFRCGGLCGALNGETDPRKG